MSQLAEQMTSVLPTLMLWAGASLIAIVLLAKSMTRRRVILTEALKKHVVDTVGSLDEPPPEDAGPKS